ncbi:MAG: 3-deoxy-manno-octulosonate cytidylyltransferase [Parvibaculales bacterium]
MSDNALIIIPARLASTRLPDKPLLDVAGKPMIVRVWERACQAGLGRVVVAAGDDAIAEAVRAAGGETVMTDPDLPSGSDRIHQALQRIDPDGQYETIINLQGDLPTIEPDLIGAVAEALHNGADMASLVAEITDAEERDDPNCVKAVIAWDEKTGAHGRALYFTRATAPHGEGPLYHHIGIYAYQRAALERFVALPPSSLEVRERLEQLRALEAGMSINMALVDTVPLGVDTQQDLDKARHQFERIAGDGHD